MEEPVIGLVSPQVPSAQLIITSHETGTPRADPDGYVVNVLAHLDGTAT